MSARHLLIIDGNERETNEQQITHGGAATGEGYAAVLRQLDPAIEYTIVRPAGDDYRPPDCDRGVYHGAVITGSALHVYDTTPAVERQLTLVSEVFDAGIPVFGSCWGLQVATVVLGGRVHANPRGRELGIARAIRVNDRGCRHPLLAGKGAVFDAVAVHSDEVAQLPAGAAVLAGNAVSEVQALEVRQGDKWFWGVQYHPEFSLLDMAAIFLRYRDGLIDDGFFLSAQDVEAVAEDYRSLHRRPQQLALSWRYGLSSSVLAFASRTRELRNWLEAIGQPDRLV